MPVSSSDLFIRDFKKWNSDRSNIFQKNRFAMDKPSGYFTLCYGKKSVLIDAPAGFGLPHLIQFAHHFGHALALHTL